MIKNSNDYLKRRINCQLHCGSPQFHEVISSTVAWVWSKWIIYVHTCMPLTHHPLLLWRWCHHELWCVPFPLKTYALVPQVAGTELHCPAYPTPRSSHLKLIIPPSSLAQVPFTLCPSTVGTLERYLRRLHVCPVVWALMTSCSREWSKLETVKHLYKLLNLLTVNAECVGRVGRTHYFAKTIRFIQYPLEGIVFV